jgi:tetratricopeptide (TPR) repeat protein
MKSGFSRRNKPGSTLIALTVVSQLLCGCIPMQDPPRPGDAEVDQAEDFMMNGKYSEAIPVLKRAVLMRALLGNTSRHLNYAKFHLGQCYARTGNYDDAQKELSQSLPFVDVFEGECLEELGDVALHKNQLSSAEAYYKDAIKYQDKQNHDFDGKIVRGKLANVLELRKENKKAEELLIWLNDNEYKKYTGIAKAYGTFDLATFYDRTGDYKKAEKFYQETCKIMNEEHEGTSEYTGYYYMKIGDFYLARKELPKAKAAYAKALELFKKGRKLPLAPEPETPGMRQGHPSVYVLEKDRVETQKKLDSISS